MAWVPVEEQEKMNGDDIMKRDIILLAGMALMSCTQMTEMPDADGLPYDEYDRVVMVIPSCEFDECPQTKNEVLLSSGIKYVWSEKDTVGIFPTSGSQLYFSMASGAGEQSASFDGGGWALKKGADYFSYFPFVADFYIDKTAIPLRFSGQTQTGNGDPSHAYLGNYCYMAAKGEYDEATKALYFNYQRLGVLFRLMIPVSAGSYSSIKVDARKDIIAEKGTYNVMAADQVIYNPEFTDAVDLELCDLTLDSHGTLVAFILLPPFDLSTGQLTLQIERDDGTIHLASVAGKAYSLGKTYNIAPNLSASLNSTLIEGSGGTAVLEIVSGGSSEYSVSSDSDWLQLDSQNGSGNASIVLTAATNDGPKRTAEITVSETVNGVSLKNVFTLTQDVNGMDVGVGDWEQGEIEDGVAD